MLGVLVVLLAFVALVFAVEASLANKAARRAAASAAEAKQLVAELTSAMAPRGERVALTKPRVPGRAELNAVLHTELVQLLGRRAAAELPLRAAPVDAVPVAAAPVLVAPVLVAPVAPAPVDAVPVPVPVPVAAAAATATAATTDDGLPRLPAVTGPVDSVGPIPRRLSGERFHYAGVHDGSAEELEFPIEWPGPDAIAVTMAQGFGERNLMIRPMTRTRSRIRTHDKILDVYSAGGRAWGVLTRDVTHLQVAAPEGHCEWSVRVLGPTELDELVDERSGAGDTMLAIRREGPTEVVIHVKSVVWRAEFICGCWRGADCDCPTPEEFGYLPRSVSGIGESLEVLTIPRPGLLWLERLESSAPWRLRLRPVGSESDE
ncbi:hypothetical protein [Kitasatospora kifunensis]|uniref:Uncharacterized protein n=1 Tax=Kitasatospora kifunensis TaxID=58351 RepID=A0A7W7VVK9_KITKI|nr:hypothetical protein [Kitasatospora kifunensis]MBB4924013.1 hypothetical protein [Kitasatospora kifunensis]